MTDISKRAPGCDDDCESGDRGERGKRGKRGQRGHEGREGHVGPTGPTGSAANAAVGLAFVFRPGAVGANAPGGNVFTDWTLLMAAIDATRKLGVRTLEFDNSFSATPGVFTASCQIPAGVWDMTDVKWINVPREFIVEVELLDGAQIVLDQTDPTTLTDNLRALQIEGYGLLIVSNRKGSVAPFFDVSFLVGGNNVAFTNTDPAALPMFEIGPDGFCLYLFSGENVNGGFGFFGTPPSAPLVDLRGGIAEVIFGAGTIENNVFTDTVGGGIVAVVGMFDEARTDLFDAWNNPALFAAGGVVAADDVRAQVRYRLDPTLVLVTGAVTPAASPYAAAYNEFVPVQTDPLQGGGAATVNLPNSGDPLLTHGAEGERVTVKDIGGAAAANNITIGSAFGNIIEAPLIANNGGSKTWVSDGRGNWWLVAQI